MVEQSWSFYWDQETEKERPGEKWRQRHEKGSRRKYCPQGHATKNSLPSPRFCLLSFHHLPIASHLKYLEVDLSTDEVVTLRI
jgi:hypothetical protein